MGFGPPVHSRVSIDRDRVRHEAGSGHAGEFPLPELTHAKIVEGVLLNVRSQVFSFHDVPFREGSCAKSVSSGNGGRSRKPALQLGDAQWARAAP